ncbi:MAG: 4-dihydromethyl-trisporate dehydrogenase [Benjaminiella poitrasii]|nr:MAG: 4-dihydromethyl-trisporate dehydrogenase [Benjaminiella poitrasii]
MTADYVVLDRTGDKMSLRDFGAEEAVYKAIKMGYRLIDGACDYGNELECGRSINKAIREGLVKREDIFVVMKLANTYYGKDYVISACERQLKDWEFDYFGLFLVHFPVPLKYVSPSVDYPPKCMHLAEKERNIDIANFNCQSILDLLTYAKIKSAQDIHITAYSSFDPTSYASVSEKSKLAKSLLEHEKVQQVTSKHKASSGQVLLRWALDREFCVIPKSVNEERMRITFDIKLDEDILSYGFDLPLFE